mgnify:CR=1 FL=1
MLSMFERPDEFLSSRKIETQTSNEVSRFSVVNMGGKERELASAAATLAPLVPFNFSRAP